MLTKRQLNKLTPNDREEVLGFQELLADLGNGLSGGALWAKYGEDYLGPKTTPPTNTKEAP